MVTITLGGLVLPCYDWSDLLKGAAKRGTDRIVPGVAGRAVRPRVSDALEAGLALRYIADNHADVYVRLATLRAVCDVNVPQDLVFDWGAGSTTVDCIVEEMGPPTFRSDRIVTLVVDVTLPDGPLDLTVTP